MPPSVRIVNAMLAALVLTLTLAAQAPIEKFPVAVVEVKGLKMLKPEQVIAAAGIQPGQQVTPAEMEAGLQKLLNCGYFDRVSYRYEPRGRGYALEWEVAETTVFYPVVFQELPAEKAREILRAADPLFGEKIAATKPVLTRYEDALNHGLNLTAPDDKVRFQLLPNEAGELVVQVRPRRPLPSVYQVDFRGNKLLRSEELRLAIAVAATGLIYREKDFRDVLDFKIRPLYEARGHLKVSFPEIQVQPAEGNKGLNILVTVAEGEEYTLGEVRFSNHEEDWLRVGQFRQGVTANMAEVEAGRRRLEQAVRRNGFLDAKVTARRTLNEERKTVDMDFEFLPGEQYVFQRLEVKGLDILTEPAVRKLWRMQPGSPFNPEYPEFFLNKIREDGVFDNLGDTRSELDVNRQTRQVAVTLYFQGAAPKPDKRGPRSRQGRFE